MTTSAAAAPGHGDLSPEELDLLMRLDVAAKDETTFACLVAETLGHDSAWVRRRHLERGISSASTVLAAASQRTWRIGLGTAVIQLGYENPFRLAEDLSTVDILSGGRLQVGVSVGPPPFGALIAGYADAAGTADHGHGRAERLARTLRSEPLSDAP